MRLFSILAITALLGLTGCGQKGPLTLPEAEQAQPQQTSQQPAEQAPTQSPSE